jgi:predicted ATPase/DNA-binding XRE family transcriptional regulator
MKHAAPGSFGPQLKALREAAGFTQEELATIAGLSVHAVSALERGERRRPHVETVRALSSALDLPSAERDALLGSARGASQHAVSDELSDVSLPSALTLLLGRDAEMQTLRYWLSDPTARLVTLTGPGGSGKTRLALELARSIAAKGGTRVVFVPLAAIRSAELAAPAIAEVFGLSDVTALDLPKRVRVACADQPTLLLLDNFEQILGAAPLVADLLTLVAPLRVIVTSRAPLRVRGEREFSVGPLSLDSDVDATSPVDLAGAPAVRLFVERVRDVQPDFRLTPANSPMVTAICRRLDALPLALELAAPWMKVLTVEDLLRRLTYDALLSTAGPRDLPERQQTMNATVAWSYQLLAPQEQRAFRRLGALPGRFPIEAAAAVLVGRDASAGGADEALDTVARLIDRSLVLRAETSVAARPLYQTLETVRAYATLELTSAGERDEAMEGLARYCASEASLAARGMVGHSQGEWLDRVRDDLESHRAALSWLVERDRPTEAAEIAWGLHLFWMIRGHAAEGLRWYEQTLALPSLPPDAETKALVGAGLMWYAQGELGRARTGVLRALELARGAGDTKMAVQAENILGHVEYGAGDVHAARERFACSAKGFKALALPWGTANALAGLAAATLATGDEEQAERVLDEADSVLQQASPWFSSLALYVRGILEVRRGNPDTAIALACENLAQLRKVHDKFAVVYALVPLAAAAALKGDDVWAAQILGARDAVTERTGATVVDESVHDLNEQLEREVRARLGPDRWTRASTEGRSASIDSLIRDIQ